MFEVAKLRRRCLIQSEHGRECRCVCWPRRAIATCVAVLIFLNEGGPGRSAT